MSDHVYQPKVSLQLGGDSVPVETAQISLELNTVPHFVVTITEGSTSGGKIMTSQYISNLVRTIQTTINQDAKQFETTLTIETLNSSKSYKYYIVGAQTYCDAKSGKLVLSITASHKDIFADGVVMGPFGTNMISQILSESGVRFRKKSYFPNNSYFADQLLSQYSIEPDSVFNSLVISKMLKDCIRIIFENHDFSPVAKRYPEEANIVKSQIEDSRKFLWYIWDILTASDNTSVLLNSNVPFSGKIVASVVNDLINTMLNSRSGLLSLLFSYICPKYHLYYSPSGDSEKSGKLITRLKTPDKVDGSIDVMLGTLVYMLGQPKTSISPLSYVGAYVPTFFSGTNTKTIGPGIFGRFPKESGKDNGRAYMITLPPWLVANFSICGNKEKKAPNLNTANSSSFVPQEQSLEKLKKEEDQLIKNSAALASQYCQIEYWRVLLGNSTSHVVLPTNVNIGDDKIGQYLEVKSDGGKLFKGLLTKVEHQISAQGQLTTRLGFSYVLAAT